MDLDNHWHDLDVGICTRKQEGPFTFGPIREEPQGQPFAWVPAGLAVLAVFCGAVWGVVRVVGALL
jgi:hypothetical protein